MSASNGWIGVDLDGTLAFYDHWRGENHIGQPIWPMVDLINGYLKQGVEVKIFTARVSGQDVERNRYIIQIIQNWLEKKAGLPRLDVTCRKDFRMIKLYDDRCVQVQMNTGLLLERPIK